MGSDWAEGGVNVVLFGAEKGKLRFQPLINTNKYPPESWPKDQPVEFGRTLRRRTGDCGGEYISSGLALRERQRGIRPLVTGKIRRLLQRVPGARPGNSDHPAGYGRRQRRRLGWQ